MVGKTINKIVKIGLSDDIVYIQPYTVTWKWLFLLEKIRLKFVLDGIIVDIQHVGSTAIPNMAAKPIIDICIAIADYKMAIRCAYIIERFGYEYKGENSVLRQHNFVKGYPTAYCLYLVEAGNEILENGVYFRDFLIQHPDIALDYGLLKRKLARRFATDRREYQQAKHIFVQQVIDGQIPTQSNDRKG
jgi:GrpB-like predicted nucleotidyltransferase (UPF0157 family)